MSETESRLRELSDAVRATEPIEESGPTAAEIEGGARRAFWIGLGGAGGGDRGDDLGDVLGDFGGISRKVVGSRRGFERG